MSGIILVTSLLGCTKSPAPTQLDQATTTSASKQHVAPRPRAKLVAAPQEISDLPAYIRAQAQAASAENRTLVVYVGASWCEPCQYFHDYLAGNEIDRRLDALTFLEFDLDRDRDMLFPAGYRDGMIPLFALPLADGTASQAKFSGGIKGPETVDYLVKRLEKMLLAAHASQP